MVESVLLFGAETWVLSEEMSRKLEGVHVDFLWQITTQRAEKQKGGTWRQVAAETFLDKARTHPLGTYIYRSQATVAEWVASLPIL